ncbi:RNA-binding protein 47 [Phtheirospermum japonicum]|uniref:RNA-binding protein 47 n=1 Tax=Phtheirospermum japonicum TaxID=374723 RepID=A0A830D8B0_9LAMI|nr:RNA-binding protein 47 [Phtheirospermum japonicum]
MSPQFEQHSAENHENAARGTEVFVGGLPQSVSEEKLHKVFSACGEIAEIRTMKDKQGNLKVNLCANSLHPLEDDHLSHISLGFCFVRFARKESAARAVREISGTVLDGKKIGVLPSSEQDTLYLGNLNKAWSANEFERIVLQVFPDIESIDLPMLKDTPPGQKQRNRGFAFVKFHSHAAAARAHRVGIQPDFRLGNLHPAVQWAEEETTVDPNELAKIKVAFVRNLPINAEENYLMQLFQPFGQVEKVVVSKKGGTPVGFVHFTERSSLDRAIERLNEKTLQGPNGGPIYKLQVEIARPMDKTKKRVRENSESTSVQDHSKLPKPNNNNSLVQREIESADPYEEAVIALPLAVKERLLRVLRLGIATRFDIDVKSLCNLKELPESNAISVLDQFMLSGAALQNKGAYLDGLISRHLVDKVGSNQSMGSLARVADTTRNELNLYSISHQASPHVVAPFNSHAHLTAPRPDIYATHYSSPHSNYPLSSRAPIGRIDDRGLLDYPLSSRTPIGRIDERGLPDYPLPSRTLIGRLDERAPPDYPLSSRAPIGRVVDERGLPDYNPLSGGAPIGRVDERGFPDYPLSSRTPVGRVDERGLPDYPLPSRALIGRAADRVPVSLTGPHIVQIPRTQTLEGKSLPPYEPMQGQSISYGRVIVEKHPSPLQTAPGSSVSYARPGMNSGSELKTVVAAGHQESRPQMRFDPFTGEPYKFDPFTGEPIRR